jgi:Sulfotransferase domain
MKVAMQNLPDVVFIGPNKSGTTWIDNYLRSRSDIRLPHGVKETFFFDRYFRNRGLSWYAAHFKARKAGGWVRTVEVAPSYFHCKDGPVRLNEALPNTQIVVSLRDPVARAWSHYCHMLRYGHTSLPLEEACVSHPEILQASRYHSVLVDWFKVIDSSKFGFVWQETLKEHPVKFVGDICDILKVEFVEPKESDKKVINESAVSRNRTLAAISRRLANIIRSHRLYFIVNFAKYIGLKRLIYGGAANGSAFKPSTKDLEFLDSKLRKDFETFLSAFNFIEVPDSVRKTYT